MEMKVREKLLFSLLVIVACVVTIVGTSYAWFTDTASTNVNKIQAGTLDVGLQMKDSNGNWIDADGETLGIVIADGRNSDDIRWEPGATYKFQTFKVVNNGNLALKYKIQINGLTDSVLLNVIEFTINGESLESLEGTLKSKETSDEYTIQGHMMETAGDEYQDKSIEGISVTVVATQDTVESDSNDNQYDKDATYPTTDTEVGA